MNEEQMINLLNEVRKELNRRSLLKTKLLDLFGVSFSVWDYGTCCDRPARKHKLKGNVQFVLWKAGERGHKKDYWHNFDPSWWAQFKKH